MAAISSPGVDEDRVTTFGIVLRVVPAVEGACCLVGAILPTRRRPAGRTLTAAAVAGALAFKLAIFPPGVVAPAEPAVAIRQAGGLDHPPRAAAVRRRPTGLPRHANPLVTGKRLPIGPEPPRETCSDCQALMGTDVLAGSITGWSASAS
ncbi:hypothetical protein [Saccharothrix luteola]|uniref:hypothetical protein n=1 Tax=Saccharothrix luteola TaxID=2893018 RepID=UPI001E4A6409|nr:hypothetical protein [Saccharothrix luteola]MCC8243378.1 hypothetical protein [Saccharothrix luteola]